MNLIEKENLSSSEMVSVARCKTLLEKDGSSYTTNEILMIRDFLYKLADYEFSVYLKEKRRDIDFENSRKEEDNTDFNEAA